MALGRPRPLHPHLGPTINLIILRFGETYGEIQRGAGLGGDVLWILRPISLNKKHKEIGKLGPKEQDMNKHDISRNSGGKRISRSIL